MSALLLASSFLFEETVFSKMLPEDEAVDVDFRQSADAIPLALKLEEGISVKLWVLIRRPEVPTRLMPLPACG